MSADPGSPVERPAPTPGERLVLALIRGYQLFFGWMYAGSCRFVPSCSTYAFEAVSRFGVLRGAALAIRRLARCHPLGGSGLDLVPAFAPTELRRGKPGVAPTELRRGKPGVAPSELRRGGPEVDPSAPGPGDSEHPELRPGSPERLKHCH